MGVAAILALCVPASGAAWLRRVYVWQRVWTPELQREIAAHGSEFDALDLLAAEITWRDARTTVATVRVPWQLLATQGRKIAVVVRVGPTGDAWREDSPATRAVVQACTRALASAQAGGVVPVELQIDFDAATSRLADYRELLRTVRREVHPPRLVITALPAWMRSADFAPLVAETDAYVLQVHSLEKPAGAAAPYTLCDPAKAREWIAQAAALGRPFRVALPAYGYLLAFDPAGKFAGLEAEGEPRTWPDGYTTRQVLADPAGLGALMHGLLTEPPAGCEGVAWFRFPLPSDERAWSWVTLHAVMLGDIPKARLTVRAQRTPGGTLDLIEVNDGEASAGLAAFRLTWRDARVLVADGLAGWMIERVDASTVIIRPPAAASHDLLRPGESRPIGWMRLNREVAVTATPLP